MKILFYNVTATFIPGGLETYCWEAGRALARRGHEVTIAAGDRGVAAHGEVALVQFPFRAEREWPDFGTRFRRLMERLSFAQHSIDHLVNAGYDAVIVNKPFDFPILWRARRRGLQAQTLFRSGGTDFFAGDRLFAGAVTHWASSSGYNARQVERRYGRPVRVIHNGVDTEVFRPLAREPALRERYGAGPGDLLIASVGRIVGWKGLRVIVEALAGLPREVRFVAFGEGPERRALAMRAEELGVAERVRFSGRVPHAELPRLLSQCDLLVQPSIGEEAFGISVVEAMACALPVFASRNGGLPETVRDGETGRLLAAGDVGAWHAALAEATADRAMLQRFGGAGRRRAESDFTWAANAVKHEDILRGGRACAGSPAR